MDAARRPISNPIVVLREEFDDWAILFNPDTAAAVGINPVGVAVWKKMDGRKSIEDIVVDVQAGFADVPGTALEEVAAFIDGLAVQGYVGYERTGDSRRPSD